jgi:hypothetical protein
MQNARDTFYITLRNRLAAVNPARTMLLRAVARPGIYVQEAEAPMTQPVLDAFALRWTHLQTDQQLPAILAQMTCEIDYATAGTQNNAGLDRGRALEQMDSEVLRILYPYGAQKMNYTQMPAAPMETMVFWSEPEFGPAVPLRDRLSRTVQVTVFAFREQTAS